MAIVGSRIVFPGGWSGLSIAAAALLAISCIPGSVRNGPLPVGAGPTRVIGTLVVASGGNEIELPDTKVFLAGIGDSRAAEAVTQLDGHFELVAPLPGRYRLCYELGTVQACGPQVTARGGTVLAGPVAVAARSVVHGRVLTGDGRPCWVSDSFFGLDVSTQVSATAGGGQAQASVRANTQGEYALLGLSPGRYELTAQCERASATATVALSGAQVTRDLPLPNRAPILSSAAAFSGNRGMLRAAPGAALELRATGVDPDGDDISYQWRSLEGGGQIQSPNAATAQWQLPAAEGLRSAYLIARDGRGGYTYLRVDVQGARSTLVSAVGQAVDELSGTPVRGATVSFGSGSAVTDANGWFTVESERRRDNRYVLNIRHSDYSLISRVFDRSTRGDSFRMTQVQAEFVPPGGEIRLVDRTSGTMCGRSPAQDQQSQQYRQYQQYQRPRPQPRRGALELRDPNSGRVTRPPSEERLAALAAEPRCLARGAAVAIPAGALRNARGARASGPIRAAIATIDPSLRALPGDYSAVRPGRAPSALQSFGAVDVRFTDAGGQPLDLRPGTTAEVRMPVPADQAATAPAAIDMWSYNETTGRWIPEGRARLERTAEGAFYVGETRHFSTINMDIEYNLAAATCVRVELDAVLSGWNPRTLRAYVTFGGGTGSQMKEVELDNTSQYHGIFLLPYTAGSTLRLELRGVSGGIEHVLLSDFIPFTPPATNQQDQSGPLIPNYPYDECGTPILLSSGQGIMPYYGDIEATGRPAFLTGPFGGLNPNPAEGATYYATVAGGKQSLGAWWQANGFDLNTGLGTNGTYTEASYMNHNDLGFGRRMHCNVPGANRLACYVTNYGLPDQNSQNANYASNQTANQRGATVAMDYDQSAGDYAVQFYVYNGASSGSTLLEFADLDGLGPKPVPHLCMVCHGGDYDGTNRVRYGRFREFDLPSFRYLNGGSWDFGQTTVPPGLDPTAFASLNAMVATIHSTTPIGDLITRWYPGGFGSNLPSQPNPVPSGWVGNAAVYHSVYARSCRTCHIAQDRDLPAFNPVFDDASEFLTTSSFVCGHPRRMPNAFITYRNFWADTQRVTDYENFTGVSNCGS